MDINEWLEDHKPEWVPRIPVPPTYGMPQRFIGAEDAVSEWELDQKPINIFTPIQTYSELKEKNALYLFGRRGTGKTALIRMLDFETKQGRVEPYTSSWVCDTHPLILALTTQIRGTALAELPAAELANVLEPVWRWFIQVSAMFAVTDSSPDSLAEPLEGKSLRLYLEKLLGSEWQTTRRGKLLEKMQQLMAESLTGVTSDERPGGLAARVLKAFRSDHHHRAASSLMAYLKQRPCLVLMDAGEVYRIRDPVSSATITALIAAVYFFASDWQGVGLYAKAAFPSEILPHVFPFNKGKMQGRIVLITWTHRDLVTFVAKRYCHALSPDADEHTLASFDNYDNARRFIYRHLPSTVHTRQGQGFDTLSYLIRHTQKTPRQLILLLNTVFTAAKRHKVPMAELGAHEALIVEGIHARLDHLVEDAIDMHKYVYEHTDTLVKRILSQQPSHFDGKQLDRMFKQVSELRRELELERIDIQRVLFEVGVLGIAQKVRQVSDGQWLLEGAFEYQLKQTLVATPGSLCVIHPMFHEYLQTRVDAKTFLYPVAYEEEEKGVLTAYGVKS
jgi:uridine kinase